MSAKPPSGIYSKCMAFLDRFVPKFAEPIWNHPAGPKTVFFWMPGFKWGLVIAAIGDLAHPPDRISIPQTFAIGLTGAVWCRYSMVVIPKNYSLLSVNVFVCMTQLYLCSKGIFYHIT